MRTRYLLGAAAFVPALAVVPGAAAAQGTASCDGRRISAIEVTTSRPSFGGAGRYWRRLARSVGLHHATTHSAIVRRFVTLHPGEPCSELGRADSERLLRAQPYLSSAKVRTMADTGGAVRVEVETVDDVPVVFSGRLRRARPAALTVGNENLFGRALAATVGVEQREGYRLGTRVSLASWQTFGRPYVLSAVANRAPVGGAVRAELTYPYLTEGQRVSWHLRGVHERAYVGLRRPAGSPVALPTTSSTADVGTVMRIGPRQRALLVGGRVVRVDRTPASTAVALTDSGAVPDTTSVLVGRYAPDRAAWAIGILGMRSFRYATVRGLDALTAVQDVPRGAELIARLGRAVPILGADSRDLLVAADVGGGWASAHGVLRVMGSAEGRRLQRGGQWGGAVMSARAEYAVKPSLGSTISLGAEGASLLRPLAPVQLALRNREGGVRGLAGTSAVGGRRAVVRLEGRQLVGQVGATRRADVGVAAFVDAGRVWAGDAPYGRTSSLASGGGVSVLAALPAGSKRLIRLDLTAPLATGGGDGRRRLAARLSFEDPTRKFRREPADVESARNVASRAGATGWR